MLTAAIFFPRTYARARLPCAAVMCKRLEHKQKIDYKLKAAYNISLFPTQELTTAQIFNF